MATKGMGKIRGVKYVLRIGEIATVIIAIFTIFVYIQTRNLIKRIERPILSLATTECERTEPDEVFMKLRVNNIGKSPAEDIRMVVGLCGREEPESFSAYAHTWVVNRIDMGGGFNYELDVVYPPTSEEEEAKEIGKDILLHVIVTYRDVFDLRNVYREDFWLEYDAGKGNLEHMEMEDYLVLKPYVDKYYQDVESSETGSL